VDDEQIGMTEAGGGSGLLLEALLALGAVDEGDGQELDGDVASVLRRQ
jgi:hypothetical protein